MTEPLELDLDHGQLGRIAYAPIEHQWTAQRNLQSPPPLIRLLGEDDASLKLTQSSDEPQREPYRSRIIKDIVSFDPLLQSATATISELLAESPSDDDEDALLGDLLAIVKPQRTDRSDKSNWTARARIHPIVITASTAGNELRFFGTIPQQMGWNLDHDAQLEAWTMRTKHTGLWESDGERVMQICTPTTIEPDESTSIVAVRMTRSIQLLRPHFNEQDGPFPPVSINPCPIQVIGLHSEQQEHSQCAHLAFNLWDHDQLAVIMSDGVWMIWDLSRRQSKQHSAKRIVRSSMSMLIDDQSEDSFDQDGWHRITWCLDANHIIACDRHRVELFDMSGQRLAYWVMPETGASHCIADIHRSVADDELVTVLTTRYVFVLRLDALALDHRITLAISWKHRFDPTDISLRLLCFDNSEDEVVLLHSRRHAYTVQYQLGPPLSSSDACITSDPVLVSNTLVAPFGVVSRPISISRMQSAPKHRPTARLDLHSLNFWQVLALDHDLTPSQSLWYTRHPTTPGQDYLLPAPDWMKTRKFDPALSANVVADDFILFDEDVSEGEDTHVDNDVRMNPPAAFTVQNEEGYSVAIIDDPAPSTDLGQVLEDIRGRRILGAGMKLLADEIDAIYRVSDIQRTSIAIANSLGTASQTGPPSARRSVQVLGSPDVLRLASLGIEDMSLATIYSRLAAGWLRSLPKITPIRTRLQKERDLRQVAASICLASHSSLEAPPHAEEATVEDGGVEEGSMISSSMLDAQGSSQLLRTAFDPTFAHGSLGRYTAIDVPPTSASKSISRILQHWTIGSDPSEYDYTATNAIINEANADLSQSDTERRKRQRREERSRKRNSIVQKKRARLDIESDDPRSQSRPDSSEGPSDRRNLQIPQSQVEPRRGRDSQSRNSSQLPVASQVQPGKFGDRLAYRGKRRAGF